MEKRNYKKIAKSVIDLEIKALKKLKNSINNSFSEAVDAIVKCQSKVILCGVGKSGLIAAKISATLSSVGTPSFSLSANDCSHGNLGSISKKDVLILMSYSGSTEELKNIIKYANRNKITLIGIMSKKNSILYKASDIKLLIPEVTEAGLGIVPTSSTINQLSIGDALAVSTLNKKKISKKDFKKFHPSGNLGAKLRTVEELMTIGNKIPFVNENLKMKKALQIISNKKLGTLIVQNNKKITTGIITDGQIRRSSGANNNLQHLTVKTVMTLNPISIDQDTLVEKALSIMNSKKITSLCVHDKKNISKKDFKKFHPSGNLGTKLRTVEELMITGNKIPFVNESLKMKKALQIISRKKLGTLIVQNNKKITTGIITDGQIRRFNETGNNLQDLTVKRVMTSGPISIDQDMLAEKALSIMNTKKITSLCVHNKKNNKKTIGILHIHSILQSNIH